MAQMGFRSKMEYMIHGLVFREKYKYNHLEEIKSEENKLMSIKKSQRVLQNKKCFSICCKMKKQNKKEKAVRRWSTAPLCGGFVVMHTKETHNL